MHGFDSQQDVSACARYSGAPLIRGSKNLGIGYNNQWQPAQTNIRVRLRLSGTSLYPSCLLVHKSKASLMRFAFISDRGEPHPRRLSNFAKTVFVKERKSFSFRDSLFCDSFLPQPLLPASVYLPCAYLSPLHAKGDTPCGKRNVPGQKNPARANAPTGFIRSASAPLYFSCKDQLTSVSDRNVP